MCEHFDLSAALIVLFRDKQKKITARESKTHNCLKYYIFTATSLITVASSTDKAGCSIELNS